MLPDFLLPECVAQNDGQGLAIDLGSKRGKLLVLTLGVITVLEQEGLEVSVWGSPDGENWGSKALATYAPKSYCGVYSILLNLVSRLDIQLVRVQWKMKRWSKREVTPMFGFYVYAEESGARGCAAAVA
jgi:hypothetical protein